MNYWRKLGWKINRCSYGVFVRMHPYQGPHSLCLLATQRPGAGTEGSGSTSPGRCGLRLSMNSHLGRHFPRLRQRTTVAAQATERAWLKSKDNGGRVSRGPWWHFPSLSLSPGGTKYVPWNVWIIPESLEFRRRHRGEDPRPGIKAPGEQCGGLVVKLDTQWSMCACFCVWGKNWLGKIKGQFDSEPCYSCMASSVNKKAGFDFWESGDFCAMRYRVVVIVCLLSFYSVWDQIMPS